MAQEWGFVAQAHAGDPRTVLPDFEDDFDHVVDVALRIDAAGDCEANQVHLRGIREHERADFYGTDPAFEIELARQSDSGELIGRDVGQESTGIKVNGVASR